MPCLPMVGIGVEALFPVNPVESGFFSGACQVLLGMRTVNGSEGVPVSPSVENGFTGLEEGVHLPVTSGNGAFSRGATVLLGTSMGRFANVLLADDKEGVMGG